MGVTVAGVVLLVIGLVLTELRDGAPWMAVRLVQVAARLVPADDRASQRDEWLSHLAELEGWKLVKVGCAAGMLVGALRIRAFAMQTMTNQQSQRVSEGCIAAASVAGFPGWLIFAWDFYPHGWMRFVGDTSTWLSWVLLLGAVVTWANRKHRQRQAFAHLAAPQETSCTARSCTCIR